MISDRISTGIAGLDALIEGGIPRGFTVLVAGNPGTGKTVLTSHFLYEGLKKGENSVYVSFGESKKQFYYNLEKFGMKFIDFEKQNKFRFLDFASLTKEGIGDALEEVLDTVRNINASRVVIDSFSAILLAFNNISEARIALHVVLGKMLRAEGVTNLLIAEVPIGARGIGSGMEEFVADGIIQLAHGASNAVPSLVKIVKMRGTAMNREPHVAVIAEKGMIVYPKQSLQILYPTSTDRIRTGIE
jgi:circadian clock protein KaiC